MSLTQSHFVNKHACEPVLHSTLRGVDVGRDLEFLGLIIGHFLCFM